MNILISFIKAIAVFDLLVIAVYFGGDILTTVMDRFRKKPVQDDPFDFCVTDAVTVPLSIDSIRRLYSGDAADFVEEKLLPDAAQTMGVLTEREQTAARLLLSALIGFLVEEAPMDERSLSCLRRSFKNTSIKGGIIMLINAIRAENLKSRHSNMWVAVLILPLLTAAIGAIIYGINASANLYDGAVWQQLWLQTGLFYGYFFFPILIAICASYLWRLEHTNHNWNSLMTTPVSRSTIFIAKLVVLAKSILAAQVLLMVFIIIVGKVVFRFEQPLPINMLWWLFMGWFSALSVGAVQLYLSMRIRSFAVPVGLAVCLSIGGLAFHIAGFSEMFPYSQIILGLSSQDEMLPIDSITTLVPMVLVYTVLFVILATHHLKKADVVAG